MAKRPPPKPANGQGPLQAMLEAALFTTAQPLPLEALCELLDISRKACLEGLVALVQRHEANADSGLEVARSEEGWIMQVKGTYQPVVDRLLPSDLAQAVLKTLTFIAMRQPVLQRDVVEVRGSGAYDHVRDLVERGLVRKTPQGNSSLLELGPRFGDYFRIDKDKLAQIQGQTVLHWPTPDEAAPIAEEPPPEAPDAP
ncbi:MAG: SMC-Scp complex subunit ScpB [Candidatus Sericytochromatia bacterium]|nr:SMC-Scp complex subunit ScpB [Candidatus Sericytochromatia bacterium]